MQDKVRKRSAPVSDEEDSTPQKPVKRPTIEASSPSGEAPPSLTLAPNSGNQASESLVADATSSDVTTSISTES